MSRHRTGRAAAYQPLPTGSTSPTTLAEARVQLERALRVSAAGMAFWTPSDRAAVRILLDATRDLGTSTPGAV